MSLISLDVKTFRFSFVFFALITEPNTNDDHRENDNYDDTDGHFDGDGNYQKMCRLLLSSSPT